MLGRLGPRLNPVRMALAAEKLTVLVLRRGSCGGIRRRSDLANGPFLMLGRFGLRINLGGLAVAPDRFRFRIDRGGSYGGCKCFFINPAPRATFQVLDLVNHA